MLTSGNKTVRELLGLRRSISLQSAIVRLVAIYYLLLLCSTTMSHHILNKVFQFFLVIMKSQRGGSQCRGFDGFDRPGAAACICYPARYLEAKLSITSFKNSGPKTANFLPWEFSKIPVRKQPNFQQEIFGKKKKITITKNIALKSKFEVSFKPLYDSSFFLLKIGSHFLFFVACYSSAF